MKEFKLIIPLVLFLIFGVLLTFPATSNNERKIASIESELNLFDENYGAIPNYALELEKITPETKLIFSNRHAFTVQEINLPNFFDFKKFRIGSGRDLLLPLNPSRLLPYDRTKFSTGISSLNEMIEGEKILSAHEIAHLGILDFGVGEYLLVEEVSAEFTYEEYLLGKIKNKLSDNEKSFCDESLKEFFISTWPFMRMGTLTPRTLVFNKERGWLQIYFAGQFNKAKKVSDETVFDTEKRENGFQPRSVRQLPLPYRIEKEVRDAIKNARQKANLEDGV